MKKRKTIIFGGNGFLGNYLYKKTQSDQFLAPTHKEIDLLDQKKVLKFIDKNEPSQIIYLAGVTKIEIAESNKDLADNLNHKIPKLIAKYASKNGIPVLYTSTDAVFDGHKSKFLFSETDKPLPKSDYGKSKYLGEFAIMNTSNKNCVLRLITLYGNNRKNFSTILIDRLKNNLEFPGMIDQTQNPLLVNIAAKGIDFSINNGIKGIYHLGSLDYLTNYDLLVKIAEKNNLNTNLIKKITFKDFYGNKANYRKKNSVLLSDKFNDISNREILKNTDESIEILTKSM